MTSPIDKFEDDLPVWASLSRAFHAVFAEHVPSYRQRDTDAILAAYQRGAL